MVKLTKQQQLLAEARLKYGLILFSAGLFILTISYLLPYTDFPIIAWIKKSNWRI